VTRHTLGFGNDSDDLALYPVDDARGGRAMRKFSELLDRFDRWTIEVFNPPYPLGRR
jgi:hypothetical protein